MKTYHVNIQSKLNYRLSENEIISFVFFINISVT